MTEKSKIRLTIVTIFITAFLFHILTIKDDHNWGGDFSQYISQSISITTGQIDQFVDTSTFRFNYSDGKGIGPILYPWGYPIVISPIIGLFGLNIFALKLWTDLFFFFSLGVTYLLFKNKGSITLTILTLTTIAFNPYFFGFKENIISDIPFYFFTLFSIFLIQNVIVDNKMYVQDIKRNVIIGVMIFLAYSVRFSGIILLPTLMIVQLINWRKYNNQFSNKRWIIIFIIPYSVFLILYIINNMLLPLDSSNWNNLRLISLRTILGNMYYYSKLLSVFFSIQIPYSGLIIYIFSLPFSLWGIINTFQKDYLYLIFLLFYLPMQILWPYRQGLRFIFPVIPFYIYFLFKGMEIAQRTNNNSKINTMLIFGSILSTLFIITISQETHSHFVSERYMSAGPYHENSLDLFSYIIKNTDSNSTISFFKPRVLTLYTDRKSVAALSIENITSANVEYIVCEKGSQCDKRVVKIDPGANKIYWNDDFNLYQLRKSNVDP